MIRHARMQGHPTLWLPGLDHASIAAQYVLDKIIAAEGESRESLGRERYLERMWQFINTTREVMLGQQRRIGASLDWSRLRFTMDEGSARAVRVSLQAAVRRRPRVPHRGADQLVPRLPHQRISDLEVIPTEETGTLWTIRYHLIDEATGEPDPGATIAVATTRPETILGDTAVAVHPDDDRYRALVGRRVRIPFVDRDVPIIADPVVDRGVRHRRGEDHAGPRPRRLRDGPAPRPADDHDPRRRRRRSTRPATATPGWIGTRRARRIVADLDARGRPGGVEAARDADRPLRALERRHRAAPQDAVVHPHRSARRVGAPARPAAARPRIVPAHFEKVWEDWMDNIHDWNVSRQLWWGHRIPAWYCPDGHVTVSADPAGPSCVRRPAAGRRPS